MTHVPDPPPGPSPRRWRPRLSVRAMMAVVLGVAVLLGWPIRRANVQRRAVEAIKKADPRAFFSYDYQSPGGKGYDPMATPPAPTWLRRLLGDEFFQEVDSVTVVGPATEDELAPLHDFGRLRSLYIRDTSGIGDGSALLRDLRNLESLQLLNPGVQDSWLVHLPSLTNLRHLDLGGTSVTDDGLARLARLVDLEYLVVTGEGRMAPGRPRIEVNRVTDAGLAHLAGLHRLKVLKISQAPGVADLARLDPRTNLTALRTLDLRDTGLTDEGLASLAGMPSLAVLTLASTSITDAGLKHLAGSTGLGFMDLSDTDVTDAGLAHLAPLKRLQKLQLSGTKVTKAGIEALREALPKLQILHTTGGGSGRALQP
ncbi:leucine-rich repeat domain-containing protein [Paludisphaera soli]|uniref:leucine-rich repeat domain-containing protein n=1 Tax=Paludisphaera soli TaxID=2712865 RepID=UPI0013EA13A5|nr:hypothetical protein [Paludisphaera soli]